MTCRLASALWLLIATLAVLGGAPFVQPARADGEEALGPVTHLRLPRYVSLRHDRTNVREGPSKTHRTLWIFQHAGLPVEITAEFDVWRRIRDSEGAEGWVLGTLLAGKRTALVAPWKKGETFLLYAEPNETSGIAAKLQAGVLGSVKTCDGRNWCRFFGNGFDGYIRQTLLWGVYPNEKF
jgi:SH3-like domain-containing protein